MKKVSGTVNFGELNNPCPNLSLNFFHETNLLTHRKVELSNVNFAKS